VESLSETETFWFSFGHMVLELGRMNTNKNFTSSNSWYKGKGDNALARSRFIGYLAGGDEELADEKLKNMGIVDGLDGVKFTMAIDGEDMTIKLNYTIQFWFDAFDLGKIPVEQSITSKLWI
jgi:hypothetical protein